MAALGLYFTAALRLRFRPSPPGVHGPAPRTFAVPADRVRFLADRTWRENERPRAELRIADRMIERIRAADEAVLDVFLLDLHGMDEMRTRPETAWLADAVRESGTRLTVIADPVNTQYRTAENPPFEWLTAAGADVIEVDLERLPHNNLLLAPAYEALKHVLPRRRFVPDPIDDGGRVSPYAIAKALTARADHRKVLITRGKDGAGAIVASANLNDCSAFYDNVAIEIDDARVAALLLETERAVAVASGGSIPWTIELPEEPLEPGETVAVTPLLGPAIKPAILADFAAAEPKDELLIGMLFLSDRDCIEAIVAASRRGVAVTIVLDGNQRSFSAAVGGFPNRVVARELRRRAPEMVLRWHDSDGEYHSKLLLLRGRDRAVVYIGSANLTRRSLLGTNLETDVRVEMPLGCRLAEDLKRYAREIRSDRSSTNAVAPRVPWSWRLAYLLGERIGAINC